MVRSMPHALDLFGWLYLDIFDLLLLSSSLYVAGEYVLTEMSRSDAGTSAASKENKNVGKRYRSKGRQHRIYIYLQ